MEEKNELVYGAYILVVEVFPVFCSQMRSYSIVRRGSYQSPQGPARGRNRNRLTLSPPLPVGGGTGQSQNMGALHKKLETAPMF